MLNSTSKSEGFQLLPIRVKVFLTAVVDIHRLLSIQSASGATNKDTTKLAKYGRADMEPSCKQAVHVIATSTGRNGLVRRTWGFPTSYAPQSIF